MNKLEKTQKNKEGVANILLVIGICLVIGGAIAGFSNIEENWNEAFVLCLIGTILNFVSTYLKYGYIKFFN